MKISGLKYLDKNDYSSIAIDSDNILVTGRSKMATVKTGIPFSESIKGLDDSSKIDEIVDYFLRNNRISLLNDCYHSVIIGNEDRLLKFKARFSEENKTKILEKYIGDRKEIVESIPVDTYIIENTSRMSAYSIIHGETMRLVLAMKDDKYLDFERRFLEELLDTVFEDEAHIKTLYHKDKDGNDTDIVEGKFIIGEHPRGCRIRVYDVNNEIKMAVISHNTRVRKEKRENEDAKKLQLKMEGF